jgi:SMI1 / KNR4 family (SUKH-1)
MLRECDLMEIDTDRFNWVRSIHRLGESYPAPETAAEFDAAERLLGSPLPASYRAFALRFGLGGKLHLLPELFLLMPPPERTERWWWDSVIDAARFWRSPEAVDDLLPEAFLRQAIIFGCDQGAYTFLFHTGEVTATAPLEYRIYQIPRHEKPEPLCNSFEEWLRWIHKEYDPVTLGIYDEESEGDSSDSSHAVDRHLVYSRFPV